MAILIKTNGSRKIVFPEKTTFSLDETYKYLECSMIQPIYLEDGRILWIDEEGKLKPHFENPRATALLRMAGGLEGDYIAGSALLTDNDEIE